jgi:hypothetical protein
MLYINFVWDHFKASSYKERQKDGQSRKAQPNPRRAPLWPCPVINRLPTPQSGTVR